jgi:hypothetical protein
MLSLSFSTFFAGFRSMNTEEPASETVVHPHWTSITIGIAIAVATRIYNCPLFTGRARAVIFISKFIINVGRTEATSATTAINGLGSRDFCFIFTGLLWSYRHFVITSLCRSISFFY